MSTAAQIAANQANSQRSTGPKTAEGKAAAAQNNFRHGFRGRFAVLPNENAEEFAHLLAAFRDEYQPGMITEQILVDRLAEHAWLSRRAQALLDDATLDLITTGQPAEPAKTLSLWLRYQTTHDRGFHKCLADLLKLRNEKRKDQIGFERHKREAAQNARKEQLSDARLRTETAQAKLKEIDIELKSNVEAPARVLGSSKISPSS